MTFVVTENCIKCKYTDCVEVCPVDCFHEGPNFHGRRQNQPDVRQGGYHHAEGCVPSVLG